MGMKLIKSVKIILEDALLIKIKINRIKKLTLKYHKRFNIRPPVFMHVLHTFRKCMHENRVLYYSNGKNKIDFIIKTVLATI